MKKTALLIMLFTILSKVLGFLRDITLSYFYGASNVSDAYLVSITIPIVIFSFIGVSISTGYIPIYSRIEQSHGAKEGIRYTNNLLNILIVICTITVLGGLLYTDQLVKVFASGFKGETLAMTIRFTRIALLGIYFSTLIYIFNGFLQLNGNFFIPALIGLPLNICIILSIFISSSNSLLALPIGSVIATATQLLLLIPFLYKCGYRYRFLLSFKDENVKNMIILVLPIVIGMSVNQINVLIDKTIASMIEVGGISALNYANRLNAFVQGIFVLSISTAMYPMISRMAADNNILGFKKSVTEAIGGISLLLIPTTVGAMLFTEPIVRLLFGRGAFDSHAITMTSVSLFYYSIGMIGYGLREVLSRAFYSLQDTKTPMINATVALFINILLNIILSKYMGIGGLALATSISALICTTMLFISLRKKIGSFGLRNILVSFIKMAFASILMGTIAKITYSILIIRASSNFSLIISINIGVLVYFIMTLILKVEELNELMRYFTGILKKISTNSKNKALDL